MRRPPPAASGGAGAGAAVFLGNWTRQKLPGWIGRRLGPGRAGVARVPGLSRRPTGTRSPSGSTSWRGPCGAGAVAEVASASRSLTCAGRGAPGAEACAPPGRLPRPPAGRRRGRSPGLPRLARASQSHRSAGPRGSGCCCLLASRLPRLPPPPGPRLAVYMPVEPGPPEGESSRLTGLIPPIPGSGLRSSPAPQPPPPSGLDPALVFLRRGVWCRERNPEDFWDPLPFFFFSLFLFLFALRA